MTSLLRLRLAKSETSFLIGLAKCNISGYAGTMFTVDDDPELLVSMSIDDCKPDGSAPCLMG